MNRPALLLVPLTLVAAATVWWLVQAGEEPPLPSTAAAPAAAKGPGPAVEAVLGGDAATTPADAGAPTGERAAATGETTLLPIPDDARWIPVRVVDRDTGAPVPGAAVCWTDERVETRLREAPPDAADSAWLWLWRDEEERARRFGWRTVADEHGIARLHQTDSTEAFARLGDRYGYAHLPDSHLPPKDGFRIEIGPDRDLAVQVLDAAGAPAIGVPIAIAQFDAAGKFQQLFEFGNLTVSRAPDGIARVRHMQRQFPAARRKDTGKAQYRLRARLPGTNIDSELVDVWDPPTTLLMLQLPPCGRVLARVPLDGFAPAEPPWVSLAGSEPEGRSEWVPQQSLDRLLGQDGTVRFDHVPLGQQLSCSTTLFGGTLRKALSGPVTAGAEVEVVLTPDRHSQLTGRLLSGDRQPLADTRFRLRLKGPQIGLDCNLRTDAGGRFLAFVNPPRKDATVETIVAERTAPGARPQVSRQRGRELRPGREDLGDLVLGEDPLLVAGRFTWQGEAPAKFPRLRVERFTVPPDGGDGQWRRRSDLQVFQDGDQFEACGVLVDGRLRITTQSWEQLPIEPVEFTIGTRDLLLALPAGSTLAATMLLPKGSRECVVAVMEATGAPTPTPIAKDRLRVQPWERGDQRWQAQWGALPPGTYRLELRPTGSTTALHTIPDVTVPAPAGGDPRLVDIDLRELLQVQVVRLFDPLGKPVRRTDAGLFPLGQPATGPLEGFRLLDAESTLSLPKGPQDLLVAVRGYRPQQVRCTGAPLDVRLQPWPQVQLQFTGLPELDQAHRLRAKLVGPPATDRPYRAQWDGGSLSALTEPSRRGEDLVDGKVALPIGDGPHTLELQLNRGGASATVELPPLQILPNASTVVVPVPAAALDAAKAAVAPKAK